VAWRSDLARAQAVVRRAVNAAEPAAVLASFANYWDLYWVLDDAEQLLLALPPSAFDDDRGVWSLGRSQTYYLRGDRAKARIYPDSARLSFEEQLRATPDDGHDM